MADIVSADVRSRMMSGIKARNTKPELILRRGLHKAGFRFRLHVAEMPGKPDIVFARHRAVILAHGCFWHGHDCHLFKPPSTRPDFWLTKIERNRTVDNRVNDALAGMGWRVGVVWECALKGRARLPHQDVIERCAEWLRSEVAGLEIRGG